MFENATDSLVILRNKLVNWYELGIGIIPNLVSALIVLGIFYLLSLAGKRIVRRLMPRISDSRAVVDLVVSSVGFAILIIGIFVGLEIMNLDKTVTSILAGAGVVGLALGFAFQEIVSNFVSGIFIAFNRPYRVGDIVEIDSHLGKVTKINLRTTSITTFQGLEVLMPNKLMFTKPFVNYTTTPERRIDLEVGVSYNDNLREVEIIAKDAISSIDDVITDKGVDIHFENFGASSINFKARFWSRYPGNSAYLKTRHEAIIKLKEAFDRAGITIPFPIRTLEIESQDVTL